MVRENIVYRGRIEVTRSVGVAVDQNIVNGPIVLKNSEDVTAIGNKTAGDMEVKENLGIGELKT